MKEIFSSSSDDFYIKIKSIKWTVINSIFFETKKEQSSFYTWMEQEMYSPCWKKTSSLKKFPSNLCSALGLWRPGREAGAQGKPRMQGKNFSHKNFEWKQFHSAWVYIIKQDYLFCAKLLWSNTRHWSIRKKTSEKCT